MRTLLSLILFITSTTYCTETIFDNECPEEMALLIREKKSATFIVNTIKEKFISETDQNLLLKAALRLGATYGHTELVDLLLDKANHETRTSLIHCAAAGNQPTLIEHLINYHKLDPYSPNLKGDYPHHYAAKNGSIESYKILQSIQPKKTARNNKGQTPLHWACKAGCFNLVKIMIENDRHDPHDNDDNGNNALHYAAMATQSTSPDVICFLMNRARITNTNNQRETPLHFAAHMGNRAIVEAILKERDKLKHERTKNGAIAALYAAKGGHFALYELLRYQNKKANESDWQGKSALHYAAAAGHAQFLASFISSCREKVHLTDYQDKQNLTPLHTAIKVGSLPAIDVLVQNCDLYNHEMHEYIKFACQHSTLHVFKELIERYNFGILPVKNELDNPLNIALKHKKNDIVHYLCQLTTSTLNKDYMLHRAIYFDNYDVANSLLQANPLLIESDYQGYSPILWAIACQNIPVTQALLNQGAQIKKLTTEGRNALHLAFINSNLELVQWLLSTKQFTLSDMLAVDNHGQTPLDLIDPTHNELAAYIAQCIWKANNFKCAGCNYSCQEIPNELRTKCGHLLCVICQTNSENYGQCYACASTNID